MSVVACLSCRARLCAGGLSIGVEGPSKAEIQIEESKVMRGVSLSFSVSLCACRCPPLIDTRCPCENADTHAIAGTCNCQYVPMAPGEYTIAIKHADQHIPGSPFTARVVGASRIRGPELQLSRGSGPASATSSMRTCRAQLSFWSRSLVCSMHL